jgi:hypothetical protein
MSDVEHKPRWQYDCGNCKFSWCCGPTCSCQLYRNGRYPEPSRERQDEVDEKLVQLGYAPQFHGKDAQRR